MYERKTLDLNLDGVVTLWEAYVNVLFVWESSSSQFRKSSLKDADKKREDNFGSNGEIVSELESEVVLRLDVLWKVDDSWIFLAQHKSYV